MFLYKCASTYSSILHVITLVYAITLEFIIVHMYFLPLVYAWMFIHEVVYTHVFSR